MKTFYFLLSLLISATCSQAQHSNMQVINSTGGSSESGGYSLEWSIGELASVNQMDAEDGKYVLTNGFVQPLQASFHNLREFVNLNNVRIYPNPASDVLQIDIVQNLTGTIAIQLSNSKGQLMYTNEIVIYGSGHIEKINVKRFPQGEYTLYLQRIVPGSGLYESQPAVYKIVKL